MSTRLALAVHPWPETMGAGNFMVRAATDAGWRRLLARMVARMVALSAESLVSPDCGEQIRVHHGVG